MTAVRSADSDQSDPAGRRVIILQAANSILQGGDESRLTRQALADLTGFTPATISMAFRSRTDLLAEFRASGLPERGP